MTREEWLKFGIENGYCSPPVCYFHDGIPTTPEEDEKFYEEEQCIHIMRPYASEEECKSIEANFAPAVWRKKGFVDDANI